jgi:hypothetical protein
MPAQVLAIKPARPFASVLKLVHAPLKVPAWSVAVVVALSGVYGYVAGRQNPAHHYVPYVGYPLVLDTTTGKACYSTPPKPSEEGAPVNAAYIGDGSAGEPAGPAIPLCGK